MSRAIRRSEAHIWERAADQWYPEPEWCSRRLFETEIFDGRVVDPCAGGGSIIRGGRAAGIAVEGMDLIGRGCRSVRHGHDFFAAPREADLWPSDHIVSNPPYGAGGKSEMRLEEQFLLLALERARSKVVLFLRAGWLCSDSRAQWLSGLPLCRVYYLSPRPSCPPGAVIQAGEKPGGGKVDYAWLVFLRGFTGAPTVHFLRRDG